MFYSVVTFVGIFIAMIAVSLLLRRRGVLGATSRPALTTILMDIVSPSLIFSSLASSQPSAQHLQAAGIVFGAELINSCLAFVIARYILHLHRSAIGVFVIATTFGSTSLIGSSLVQILFNHEPEFTALGLEVGQFGVGLPLNTIGLLIAIHFGDRDTEVPIRDHIRKSLTSPFMIALFAGIGWSLLDLPTKGYGLEIVFGSCKTIAASLTFFAAMVIGLSVERIDIRSDVKVVASASIICLVIEPLMVFFLTKVMSIDAQTRLITNLFAAMPASPLVVAFALKYGGDVGLASKLAIVTLLLSAVTLPLIALIA